MKTAHSFLLALLCCSVSLDAAAGDCKVKNVHSLEQLKVYRRCLKAKLDAMIVKMNSKYEVDRHVAFSVSLADKERVQSSADSLKRLVFKHVETNIGNAYNSHSGVFTAPFKGVYHFQFHIYGEGPGKTGAHLMKNSEPAYEAYTYQNVNYWQAASNSMSLMLHVGDKVTLNQKSGQVIYDNSNHHTTFSGHLLFHI